MVDNRLQDELINEGIGIDNDILPEIYAKNEWLGDAANEIMQQGLMDDSIIDMINSCADPDNYISGRAIDVAIRQNNQITADMRQAGDILKSFFETWAWGVINSMDTDADIMPTGYQFGFVANYPFTDKLTSDADTQINYYRILQYIANHDTDKRKGCEILMTADCSAGKTYSTINYLSKWADIMGKRTILACPNVAQVLQNNHVYGVTAIAGKSHNCAAPTRYTCDCTIYDKLMECVSGISDLSDYIIVIDEAHQIIDARSYRVAAIQQLKAACRRVVDAGGTVIYMSASTRHICKDTPDNNRDGLGYNAIFNFIRVSDQKSVNCAKYPYYDASIIGDDRDCTHVVKNTTIDNINLIVAPKSSRQSVLNTLADYILTGIKNNSKKNYLVQSDDKNANRLLQDLMMHNNIKAINISSDDTGYVGDRYLNLAYDDIVRNGHVQFGSGDNDYQVIFTTCLLNNGTSITDVDSSDPDIKENTEVIYVSFSRDQYHTEGIRQFFLRIRYHHNANTVIVPKDKYVKNVADFENLYEKELTKAEKEADDVRKNPIMSKSKERRAFKICRKNLAVLEEIEVQDIIGQNRVIIGQVMINKNIVAAKADDIRDQQMFGNVGAMAAHFEEEYGVAVNTVRSETTYEIKNDMTINITDADITDITDIFSDTISENLHEFADFANGDVRDNNGKTELETRLDKVSPLMSGYVRMRLILSSRGNIAAYRDRQHLMDIAADITDVIAKADGDRTKLAKVCEDDLNALYINYWTHYAATDIYFFNAFSREAGMSFEKYATISSDEFAKYAVAAWAEDRHFAYPQHDDPAYGIKMSEINAKIRSYYTFMATLADFAHMRPAMGLYYYLTHSNNTPGWVNICKTIAMLNTAKNLTLLKNEYTAVDYACGRINYADDTIMGYKYSILLSEGAFAAMHFIADPDKTGLDKWTGNVISHRACIDCAEYLRSELKNQHNYYIGTNQATLTAEVLHFYASIFNYDKSTEVEDTITANGSQRHCNVTSLQITGIRTAVTTAEPAVISFVHRADSIWGMDNDTLQIDTDYAPTIYKDVTGTPVAIINRLSDVSLYKRVSAKSVVIYQGTPVAYYDSDFNGNGLADRTDANGNIVFVMDRNTTVDIKTIMQDPDTITIPYTGNLEDIYNPYTYTFVPGLVETLLLD